MKKITGHESIVARLKNAIAHNRLPSTFLFVGPSSVGKRLFALEFSKSLFCPNTPDESLDYCNQCESCHLFDAGNHPDFSLVSRRKDKAYLQIEQFIGDRDHRNRKGLCHDMALKPFFGGRKIAVIEDGDFFNQESANCLLKLLEEPPPGSVLVIVGSSEQKQLDTIRSRSQIVRFQQLTREQIESILKTTRSVDGETLEKMVRFSNGSLSVVEDFQIEDFFSFREKLFERLGSSDPASGGYSREVIEFVESVGKEAASRRDRIRKLAEIAIEFYSCLNRANHGVTRDEALEEEIDPTLFQAIQSARERFSGKEERIVDCLERCMDVHTQVAANANQATLIEQWLSDLGKLLRGEEIYRSIRCEVQF